MREKIKKFIIETSVFILGCFFWLGVPYLVARGGRDYWFASFGICWFILFMIYLTLQDKNRRTH